MNTGIVPTAIAINGTSIILGIIERSIRTIAIIAKPSQDIAAIKRNRLTYFSGCIFVLCDVSENLNLSQVQFCNIWLKHQ